MPNTQESQSVSTAEKDKQRYSCTAINNFNVQSYKQCLRAIRLIAISRPNQSLQVDQEH